MTHRLELFAPAKINLGLEILRRRTDGFHDLNTVFAALAFGDTVGLAPRTDDAITCAVSGAELPLDQSNLAVRAGRLLQEAIGTDRGLDIVIEKRIPMGAGLGGGSSDAAAVLIGAPVVWNLEIRRERLLELALDLGSDVPFFLSGGLVVAGSRGERLERIDVEAPWFVLLVNPGIHVSTPEAFAAVSRTGERRASDLATALADPRSMRATVVNDFEAAVFAAHPQLAVIKRELYAAGAFFALMSGSGSTMYGLFEERSGAERALERFSDYWSVVTSIEP
jgi:4-diphosphocytidyl-2-C-methyl-D-erythritol kinase